jgi:DNA ligase (NAD+)
LKVDSLALQQEIGVTSKAPRWAIAYKYPQEQAISRLEKVVWQVGRSQLTPVAVLEPVELGGTTVSRASLHNIDQIREKDIRVGDRVVVEKAGYIIPYIVKSLIEERLGSEEEIQIPSVCPECEGPISVSRDENAEGTTQVRCDNPGCRGVIARRIQHFVVQMEIENIGPQLIEQLLGTRLISRVEDLLQLQFADFLKLERMGEKSAGKIVENISRGTKARLGQVIAALGIGNVGIVIAEKIAEACNQSLSEFRAVDREKLMAIEGISDKVADSILGFLADPDGSSLLNALQKWWQGPDLSAAAGTAVEAKLRAKSFVVTGEAELPRKQIEKLIKAYGGTVKASVSNKTDFLLIGSKEPENFVSSKKNKALELKIPVINEFVLFEMVGANIEALKDNG